MKIYQEKRHIQGFKAFYKKKGKVEQGNVREKK